MASRPISKNNPYPAGQVSPSAPKAGGALDETQKSLASESFLIIPTPILPLFPSPMSDNSLYPSALLRGEGKRAGEVNRDLKPQRSFLYNNYTKNNRFLAGGRLPIDRLLSLGNAREFYYGPPVIKKHFPTATKEWNNSVYAYNSKRTILLSIIDKIVKKLIKSYFNSYFLSSSPKIRELSVLNKVYVSKPEIKHTNSKVIITIYKYGSSINNKNQIKINDWQNQHINNTLSKNLTSLVRTPLPPVPLPAAQPQAGQRSGREKDTNLYYFSDLISKFYGSRVELRIIDLKYLHLNTSILVEYLSNKLTSRKKVLKKYRLLLRKIKLPVYSKHKHDLIGNKTLKELSLLNNISNLSVENLKKNKLVNKHLLTNMALSSIKYKAVVGARFEIGGRLTRRNIASKSVFKFGQVGTLKNIDASYKGLPVVTLRGNHRPNLDFSSFNTRTRNGAYNVKG